MIHDPEPAPAPAGTELTLRAVCLGVALSCVLGAANAYLGLFAGMTVSASIPAAVLSMGLMRAVRGSILENNLVQTAASAGESAAAGAIFTLPALLLLGSWRSFPWLDCTLLLGCGGALGVFFTILLRGPLITQGTLPFPEGVATAQVLEAGHGASPSSAASGKQDEKLRALLMGGLLGGGFKFLESGLGVCRGVLEGAVPFFGGAMYFGVSASPALLSVGYIVGLRIAYVICLGGLLNWLVVIPLISANGPDMDALELAWATWSSKTRYLGVGAMTFSGLFTLIQLRSTIRDAIVQGVSRLRRAGTQGLDARLDLPLSWLAFGVFGCAVILTWLFARFLPNVASSFAVTLFVLVISFLFSTVAAYMAGLLGSSNNPVSGVTIATIILVSLMLLAVGIDSEVGARATIFVGSVVCTAAAIGGDNMQDLKAGHLLGASPRSQQIMQLCGVAAAAVILGPTLQLLADSYGFFEPTLKHPRPLMAPQASLMAEVSRGMFGGALPWGLISAGLSLGAVFSALDTWLAKKGSAFRMPPLVLALGLYLPLQLSTSVLLGGLASAVAQRRKANRQGGTAHAADPGVLASAGLITGEALVGVLLSGIVLGVGGLASIRLDWNSGVLSFLLLFVFLTYLVRKGSR